MFRTYRLLHTSSAITLSPLFSEQGSGGSEGRLPARLHDPRAVSPGQPRAGRPGAARLPLRQGRHHQGIRWARGLWRKYIKVSKQIIEWMERQMHDMMLHFIDEKTNGLDFERSNKAKPIIIILWIDFNFIRNSFFEFYKGKNIVEKIC